MEDRIKNLFILCGGCLIFCLIMYLAFVQSNNVEIVENGIGYSLVFKQLGICFVGFSVLYFFWDDILSGIKYIFSSGLSLFYSIIVSVVIIMYLASGMLNFVTAAVISETVANIFIIVLILQPLVFLIPDKDKKAGIMRACILILVGFITFLFFFFACQNLPNILSPTEGKFKNVDILFLSFMSS